VSPSASDWPPEQHEPTKVTRMAVPQPAGQQPPQRRAGRTMVRTRLAPQPEPRRLPVQHAGWAPPELGVGRMRWTEAPSWAAARLRQRAVPTGQRRGPVLRRPANGRRSECQRSTRSAPREELSGRCPADGASWPWGPLGRVRRGRLAWKARGESSSARRRPPRGSSPRCCLPSGPLAWTQVPIAARVRRSPYHSSCTARRLLR
jgi:hypothetical protein